MVEAEKEVSPEEDRNRAKEALTELFSEAEFTADFNGDGKPDLLSGNVVVLGNGDGTFNVLPPFSTCNGGLGNPGTCLFANAVADFNGDGIPDLWVMYILLGPGTTGLLLGNGDGTFGPLIDAPANQFIPNPLVADMNGDGRPDIVVTWSPQYVPLLFPGVNGVAVLLNNTPPDFTIKLASGSSTSQTVSAGQSAKFSLLIAPSASFSGTVNLSCGITPVVTPAPTCNLSSSSVQVSSSATQPVTVTVATVGSVTTGTVSYFDFPPRVIPAAWTLMFLGSGWLLLGKRKRLANLAAPLIVLALASCLGCGGSSSSHMTPGTPAGTYTATITATSGGLSHNMSVTVIVK